jgi:aspartyl-tRNA(Asn)/glutamyl-tRNA(Gln) amidotransferase subunit A
LTRTPGCSSGGSAAAVSAGIVPLATATDGGGSTRTPASFTGLVGHKPSFGRVPIPLAGRAYLDCPGVLTATVAETAAWLDVAAGPDDRDKVSLPANPDSYRELIEQLSVRGLRAAWSDDYGYALVDPEAAAVSRAAAEALVESAGLELVEVDVRFRDVLLGCWLPIATPELEQAIHELDPDGRRRGELTDMTLSCLDWTNDGEVPSEGAVDQLRFEIELEMARIMAEVDVLLSPTAACAAFAADASWPITIDGRPADVTGAEPFTVVSNISWNPAISVPAGLTGEGLPVGLHIVGRRHRDDVVLRLARIFEQTRPWPLPPHGEAGKPAA